MKTFLLIMLISITGCTFMYDSRGQNSLKVGKGAYAGASVDNGLIKTGRIIIINFFQPHK